MNVYSLHIFEQIDDWTNFGLGMGGVNLVAEQKIVQVHIEMERVWKHMQRKSYFDSKQRAKAGANHVLSTS